MRSNWLQLNTIKTEILWCTTSRWRQLLPTTAVEVGANYISPSSAVHDPGTMTDSDVSMRSHVSWTVSGSFAVLRQIRNLRRSVSVSVFTSLVVLLIMPRLHYGNTMLAGLPENQHRQLQSVLNAATRLIYRKSRCEHVTPLLRELHWRRFRERVDCKLAVLIFRCLHGLVPRYLADDIRRVADTNCRRLRSSSSALLTVRPTRLVTMGGRAFPVAGSRLWNTLLHDVTSAPTLSVFCNRLKSHVFKISFPHN